MTVDELVPLLSQRDACVVTGKPVFRHLASSTPITSGALVDDVLPPAWFARSMIEATVLDVARNNGLTVVAGPWHHDEDGRHHVVVKVAGLFPHERVPQGWRALFRAP